MSLHYIDMITPTFGWGVANHRVLTTHDGGSKWASELDVSATTRSPGNDFAFASVAGVDAWLAVKAPHNSVQIGTPNEGGEWVTGVPMRLPKGVRGGGVLSLQFLNEHDGWLMITGGGAAGSIAHELLHTTDGGAHWKRVEFNYISKRSPYAIPACDFQANVYFSTLTTGWAAGVCGPAPSDRVIFETEDGGRKWFVRRLPPPAQVARCGAPHCQLYFATQPPVFVGAAGALGEPSPARRGASVWNHQRRPDLGSTNPIVTGCGSCVLTPQWMFSTAIASGSALGKAWRTEDGGESWSLVSQHPHLGVAPRIQFINATDGFALRGDNSPYLRVTTNGGLTWHHVQTYIR